MSRQLDGIFILRALKWKKPRLTKKRESGNVLKWDVKGESLTLTQDLPHSFRKLAPSICQQSPLFIKLIEIENWLD